MQERLLFRGESPLLFANIGAAPNLPLALALFFITRALQLVMGDQRCFTRQHALTCALQVRALSHHFKSKLLQQYGAQQGSQSFYRGDGVVVQDESEEDNDDSAEWDV